MPKTPVSLPSYQELAQLVVDLTEMNVANLHKPDWMFICCYTFETQYPTFYLDAIRYRRILLENQIVSEGRNYKEHLIPKKEFRQQAAKPA